MKTKIHVITLYSKQNWKLQFDVARDWRYIRRMVSQKWQNIVSMVSEKMMVLQRTFPQEPNPKHTKRNLLISYI